MSNESKTVLVFLDLETTGLDPEVEQILELGIVLLDADTLDEIGRSSWCVWPVGGISIRDPYVLRMHTNSGLLADVAGLAYHQKNMSAEYIEDLAVEFLSGKFDNDRLILAGNSVHFDRSFLRVHMPNLERMFYHRHCDVSAARTTLGVAAPEGVVAHRVLADCDASIAEMKRLRLMMGRDA